MRRVIALVRFLGRIEGFPIFLVLVVLYAALMLSAPTVFLKTGIYMSFLETVPPVLIVGLGLTLVITAGEIDLSFPAVVAFAGLAFSWTYRTLGAVLSYGPVITFSGLSFSWPYRTFDPAVPAFAGLFLALAAGALVGYINGLLVARVGVPSIMATIASQFFWYGVTILLAGGLSVALKGIKDNVVHELFVGQLWKSQTIGGEFFAGFPVQALWALALAVFLWFILNRHKFGEAVSFIGDNANVARVMGINVEATKIQLFTLHGVISAFSGIILTLDIGVFYPNQGNYLLPAMAGVFVGGTSIAGGAGSVFGTLWGAYIIGSLEAGVVATQLSGYWVQLVEGLVMGAVVVLNALISEGRLATLSNRLRHWSVPVGRSAISEVSEEGDAASK